MFEIQISKRRQKFTTKFAFGEAAPAKAFFGILICGKNERKRLVEAAAAQVEPEQEMQQAAE